MVMKGEEDQTIEEGLDLWRRSSEIDGPLSIVVAEQRIGPMIQQESDNFDSHSGTGDHQSRHSLIVLVIDITSQGEETINSLCMAKL